MRGYPFAWYRQSTEADCRYLWGCLITVPTVWKPRRNDCSIRPIPTCDFVGYRPLVPGYADRYSGGMASAFRVSTGFEGNSTWTSTHACAGLYFEAGGRVW